MLQGGKKKWCCHVGVYPNRTLNNPQKRSPNFHSCKSLSSSLLFSESLSSLIIKTRTMLVYSILELLTQAASSSAFIFCFCNLIIVIILMDLKPRLSFDQASEIPVSMARTQKAEENSKRMSQKEGDREMSQDQMKEEEEAGDNCSRNEENLESDSEEEEEEMLEEEEEEDDDELRRKVEEFIEKINKGWKAEILST